MEGSVQTGPGPQTRALSIDEGIRSVLIAHGIIGGGVQEGPGSRMLTAATLDGTQVISSDGESVGKISDIVLDVRNGRIAYAVLSEGGFLGIGSTQRAIPWNALTLDTDENVLRVDITAQRIKDDPGFDKDHWPSMEDEAWGVHLHHYYERAPYWTSNSALTFNPGWISSTDKKNLS